MLTFESPFYEISGVVVFRDHAVPTLFHYLAGPPRLTRDEHGKASMLLLKYRHALDSTAGGEALLREQLGGAFLTLGVDCGLSQDTKDDIKRKLESLLPAGSGPVSLVPVLYTKGTVSIIALDAQLSGGAPTEDAPAAAGRFVRGVQGTSTPSLLDDQSAIFSLSLTPDAATLLEEAYASEMSPIGVMYDLELTGLRPALAVKAHVDLGRVYDEMKIGGGIESTYLEVDIEQVLEKLRQTSDVKIEIIRQQEGQSVAEMEKSAMDLLKDSILHDLFSPTMSQQPAADPQAAMAAAAALQASTAAMSQSKTEEQTFQIGFHLKLKNRDELKIVDYDYSVAAPEKRTHAPNGFFAALVKDEEKAEQIREIDLDDPFFKILDVRVTTTANFEALDLKTASVDLQYGGSVASPSVTGSAEFTPEAHGTKPFRAFRDGADLSYRYKLAYAFGQAERIAAQSQVYESPWRTTTSRALIVHPEGDVAMLRVYVEPGVVDWDIVSTIETRLVYEDEPNAFRTERSYLLAKESPRQEWIVRLTDKTRTGYVLQNTWHMVGGRRIVGPEIASDIAHLFVGDPFADRLPILIHPQVDPGSVERVVVELRYDDEENHHEVRKAVELVGPTYATTTVTIPLIDPKKRQYSYQVSLIKTGGAAENQHPIVTDQLSIVVTEGGVYLDVAIALLGDLAQKGVDAVVVHLRSEPLDGAPVTVVSHLFEPGQPARITKRLLLRADRPRVFEYRTEVFLQTGEQRDSEWTSHETAILAIPVARLVTESTP